MLELESKFRGKLQNSENRFIFRNVHRIYMTLKQIYVSLKVIIIKIYIYTYKQYLTFISVT